MELLVEVDELEFVCMMWCGLDGMVEEWSADGILRSSFWAWIWGFGLWLVGWSAGDFLLYILYYFIPLIEDDIE